MIMSELPQELLEEILCRVPAISLKRLRTTCKQWSRLFNDREFSRKHYDKATKQLLVLTGTEELTVCLLNVNLHNGIPSEEVTGELSLNQRYIDQVSHCDGLLLCTIRNEARMLVWNPCTGQAKWIQSSKNSCHPYRCYGFVLGYSQDIKSCSKSYKILSYLRSSWFLPEFEIYDVNSDSWMKTDLIPIPDYRIPDNHILGFRTGFCVDSVSLKGRTYWCAYDEEEEKVGLLSFDYTRERFERLRLPYHCDAFFKLSLSVAGEDKLSVLLQLTGTARREIWVTNKIDDETKDMSWSKLLEVEVSSKYCYNLDSFFVNEEKKIVVFCEKCMVNGRFDKREVSCVVWVLGEDNKAKQVDIRELTPTRPYTSVLGHYVPSLNQIPQPRGKGKRKRNQSSPPFTLQPKKKSYGSLNLTLSLALPSSS